MKHPGFGDTARIDVVDALRGLALMGLLLVHACDYFELYWPGPVTDPVHSVVISLFTGKAFAIFALLFGLSFFIIMNSARQRGVDFSVRFVWRLIILFVIGFLHAAMFVGDILQVLAIAGLILLAVNRLRSRWLLALAAVCLCQPLMLFHLWQGRAAPGIAPLYWTAAERQVFAHGDLGQVIAINLGAGMASKLRIMWDTGRIAQILGLSLTGMVLGRVGFFRDPARFARWRRFGLVGSVIATVLLHFAISLPAAPSGTGPSAGDLLVHSYSALAMTGAWILGFAEVYTWRWPRWGLRWLAPAGQMALTLYVMQSVVCVPLFYGYGFGLYSHINQVGALGLGIGLFAVQLVFAQVWFRFFHYGPLEWLWRAGTYGTLNVPFRRRHALRAQADSLA